MAALSWVANASDCIAYRSYPNTNGATLKRELLYPNYTMRQHTPLLCLNGSKKGGGLWCSSPKHDRHAGDRDKHKAGKGEQQQVGMEQASAMLVPLELRSEMQPRCVVELACLAAELP